MDNVLEILNLRKAYDGFALRDVSFFLPQGYIMGLIGPNGAGKTTLIKLILNVIRRDGGEIRVFGLDNLKDAVAVKSRIGFVHETPYLYDNLSLKEIKAVIAPFYRDWDESAFRKLIDEFALPLNKTFRRLSRGMKMKFALSLALAHHADFLILDEPTSGLDPIFRRELLARLQTLIQDEKKSVLFSTHITTDLERIADYITFIHNGRIVLSSAKDDLLENWAVVKGGNELLREKEPLFRGVRKMEFGFEALTDDVSAARRRWGEKILTEKATLEDIMFFTTRRNSLV